MTRIFDALKKAEAAREAAAPAPVTPLSAAPPAHAPGVRGPAALRAPADAGRGALPLVGGLTLSEETIREMTALRVGLEASLRDRAPKIVMFLSPQGGEGTSTVALQFAQVLARDPGVRPLLIDTQVRRPAYAVDAARRCAVLDPRVIETGEQAAVVASNLYVVPAPEDLRRTGLFQPATLRQLLDATVAGFDWVVLDGPPVLESPDASALGAIADGVVIVIQAGRTKRPVLLRTSDLLQKAGARVLGSVLNRRVHEIPGFIYKRI